jgi:hypothetical protein
MIYSFTIFVPIEIGNKVVNQGMISDEEYVNFVIA